METAKARKILGEGAKKYSDEELQEVINSLTILADTAIDQLLSMTPEERAKFKTKK